MKLQPWQRGAFAKEHCGDDPQLLKDLLVLLQNAEKPADSLDRPMGRVDPGVISVRLPLPLAEKLKLSSPGAPLAPE